MKNHSRLNAHPSIPVFAITTRGLEAISAQEMAACPGLTITQTAYRRVEALGTAPQPLTSLRTVDDVFIELARWRPISHQRAELNKFTKRSAQLPLEMALSVIRTIRPLPKGPRFSVTANFVGKRNYTAPEIKLNVQAGIMQQYPRWLYVEDDHEADLNLRIFIEHDSALVGLRLTEHPLHRRTYKTDHLPGSLKPSVAAALLHLAETAPGQTLVDPFCGTGTILIEAAQQGLAAIGGDVAAEATHHARVNAENAHLCPTICQWDAHQLPMASASVDLAVTNLPWGRQIVVNEDLKTLYDQALREMQRVVKPGGKLLLLTSVPELLPAARMELTEISLFGQNPHIVTITNTR